MLERLYNSRFLAQFLKFLLVGVINTIIDVVVYFFLTRMIPFLFVYRSLAKTISYSVGVLNSYIWNKSWTFNAEVKFVSSFVPFVVVNVVAVLINTGSMFILYKRWQFPEMISLVASIGIVFLWNFILSKFVVFK